MTRSIGSGDVRPDVGDAGSGMRELTFVSDESELVAISLEEPSSETDVRAGQLFSGVVRIPAWPPEESELPVKVTEWFLFAENARFEPDSRSAGIVSERDDGRSCLCIPFEEGAAGGLLYFKIVPIREGDVSIDLYSLEGRSGAFDLETRPLWRRVGFEFRAYAPMESGLP